MPTLFHNFSTTSWTRVTIIIASFAAFWAGMESIIPTKYYHVVTVVLGSLTAGIAVLMRSGEPKDKLVR